MLRINIILCRLSSNSGSRLEWPLPLSAAQKRKQKNMIPLFQDTILILPLAVDADNHYLIWIDPVLSKEIQDGRASLHLDLHRKTGICREMPRKASRRIEEYPYPF